MKKLIYAIGLGMVLSFGISACSPHDEVLNEMDTPVLEAESDSEDEEQADDGPGSN